MKKKTVAIITIAGLSSRFNQDIPAEHHKLKAIYHEGDPKETLLFHMLSRIEEADRIILVAGYRIDDLISYLDSEIPKNLREKISVVTNDHYEDWSSGYSLYLGIKEAFKHGPQVVIFAEGDLDVDDETFSKVVSSDRSVITCNHELIRSNKAVIGYCNSKNQYKYSFSTTHGLVSVDEPFSILFNSGQIWKFTNMEYLREANDAFESVISTGTNLLIVRDYFSKQAFDDIELLDFQYWVNCNTREDYRKILANWENTK